MGAALECAFASVNELGFFAQLRAARRALSPLVEKDSRTATEILQTVRWHLVAPGWVGQPVGKLLDAVEAWTNGPVEPLGEHLGTARDFAARTRELFTCLDANLRFQAPRLHTPDGSAAS